MQPGDIISYEGAAVQLSPGVPVQVDGRFLVLEQIEVDGVPHVKVEDERLAEMGTLDNPDLHRYLIAADALPASG